MPINTVKTRPASSANRLYTEGQEGSYWLRVGDADDYHPFPTPYEAGTEVGYILSFDQETINEIKKNGIESETKWVRAGVSIGKFSGHNYISIYYGDSEGEYIRDLTQREKLQFLQGIEDAIMEYT